jgi:hypothetical protein
LVLHFHQFCTALWPHDFQQKTTTTRFFSLGIEVEFYVQFC